MAAENFGFALNKVEFYPGVFDEFKNGPRGEIGQGLHKRGEAIQRAAKRQVGVDTGALRASIYFIHERVGVYQQLRIGSVDHIALLHHEGSRPHSIRPNQQRFLKFSSRGRVVITKHVNHPGTRPNRYLSDNLFLAYV